MQTLCQKFINTLTKKLITINCVTSNHNIWNINQWFWQSHKILMDSYYSSSKIYNFIKTNNYCYNKMRVKHKSRNFQKISLKKNSFIYSFLSRHSSFFTTYKKYEYKFSYFSLILIFPLFLPLFYCLSRTATLCRTFHWLSLDWFNKSVTTSFLLTQRQHTESLNLNEKIIIS